MKAQVDSKACVGHGQCAVHGPDVFILDEVGYVKEPSDEIEPHLVGQAQRGADACPERAITLSG